MLIALIVALDENGCIGVNNRLPWRLPSDLRRFKQLTMGHNLIMGRKTWESIGRPLPGRTMLVVSRQTDYSLPDDNCHLLGSLEQALDYARRAGEAEVFVIGGGEIFRQALPLADRIYLTRVHTSASCEVYFPAFDPANWVVIESIHFPAAGVDPLASTFQILQRQK